MGREDVNIVSTWRTAKLVEAQNFASLPKIENHHEKNMTRAIHWYEKAAEAGDEVAAWKVKQLEEEESETKEDNDGNES